jgi:hypothetical protein
VVNKKVPTKALISEKVLMAVPLPHEWRIYPKDDLKYVKCFRVEQI